MENAKLPPRASLDYLRKLAKERLRQLRRTSPDAKLAAALLEVAQDYGFPSWRALRSAIEDQRGKAAVPGIKSPMMRFLAVTDVSRSVVFYQHVMGFEVREQRDAEAILGLARIRLGREGYSAATGHRIGDPGSRSNHGR